MILVSMSTTCTRVYYFNAQFFEMEHVLDVSKIKHDIMDSHSLLSPNTSIVRTIHGLEPKPTCPLVPIMHPLHFIWNIKPSSVESLYCTQTL